MIACLLAPWSEEIILILLGQEYVSGATTLLILLFIPIHQSMNQIQTLFLLGTNEMKLYLNSGLIFMIGSVIVSFILFYSIAKIFPDYQNTSFILGLKIFFLQLIQFNIVNYLITQKYKYSFEWLYQPINFIILLLISFCSFSLSQVFIFSTKFYYNFLIGSIIYALLILLYLLLRPESIGLDKEIIFKVKGFVQSIIKKVK